MNILIVEDDDKKRGSVLSYLHQEFDGLKIDEGYSVESGVQKAVDNQYDLIINELIETYVGFFACSIICFMSAIMSVLLLNCICFISKLVLKFIEFCLLFCLHQYK